MSYRQDLFNVCLGDLRRGKALEEASEKLNELVRACQDTIRNGSITIKLTIKPDKSGNGQYFVTDDISTSLPKFDKGETLLYATPEGNLQRTDPMQDDMFETRAVPTPKTISVEEKREIKSLFKS